MRKYRFQIPSRVRSVKNREVNMKKLITLLLVLFSATQAVDLQSVSLSDQNGLQLSSCVIDHKTIQFQYRFSFFSVEIDDSLFYSNQFIREDKSELLWKTDELSVRLERDIEFKPGLKYVVEFENRSDSRVKIANVVPFGEGKDRAYITGYGPFDREHYLSRTVLFTPDLSPVGVVMPDNAWESGFCDIAINAEQSLVALARRTGTDKARTRRWWTTLQPGGTVEYTFYIDSHPGTDWRKGLEMMFHQRWLYDMQHFDQSLYDRPDLQWIRDDYFMLIQMAWDKQYYDYMNEKYVWNEFLTHYDPLWGNIDVFILWPTWPRLGLDQRNQWDMYGDLPGGLEQLRQQVQYAHAHNTQYFISYNPWDTDTRDQDHLKGMERLLRQTNADGVVLDTRGESSQALQSTADRVKPGIVMYSEGMPVPKHMPTIVTGRVHDAIYLPPPINLNKYIFPENQIYRVLQLKEGELHREVNICLFNGYGMELNIMRAGRPDWMQREFAYMGRILKVLRNNSTLFSMSHYQPLIPVEADSIWVNKWEHPQKSVYTVYSLVPGGFSAPLIRVDAKEKDHFVSLWHHEELDIHRVNGASMVAAKTRAFDRSWLDSRKESNIDCIARFSRLLQKQVDHDSLTFSASKGDRVVIWAGNPGYNTDKVEFEVKKQTLSLRETFGGHEGKFVMQLFDGNELIDETVFRITLATPRLITRLQRTPPADEPPAGMVNIPGGEYTFEMSKTEEPNIVLKYPDYQTPRQVNIKSFYMDEFPVTNLQYKTFLDSSGYVPEDTVNFLHHWHNGEPPESLLDHPVVNVSLEDARAYAKWAKKRLPTDIEWQYAAQGREGIKYPWGNEMDSSRCNFKSGATTAVDAFPTGASPFGVMDMVGNVWQLVNDVYDNGSYYFAMMRGGCYYNPDDSMWYIKGGPWPVDQHKLLLLVSPCFDRNATVGFRCVKDLP